MSTQTESPANRGNTGRNDDGTFKPGVSGNPSGRPKDTMKDYLRHKFTGMDDKAKEEFVKTNKVSGEMQIKLAEGNPANATDLTTDGQPLKIIFDPTFNENKDG